MTGQTISHYRILEKLGEGGMGVVYKAGDIHLSRFVALKFLHSSEDVPRLLREAQTAGSLNHPNICTIHEVDPERGFIAMELIEGESLAAKLGGRPLPVEKAVGLAMQICEGLEAAHGKGVIHRDIKSANLLVTAEGHVKILDFGLARVVGQPGLTREGAAAGTPGYMAPEQMRGEPADQRTDIWAMGAVLHEMLTGRPPMGQSETLPEGVSRIVRKALAAEPGDRYQHVDELLVDLRALRKDLPVSALKPSPRSARHRKMLMAGGWAAIGLVILFAGYAIFGRARQPASARPAVLRTEFSQLTSQPGIEWFPSLSPDGKWMVYGGAGASGRHIYLQGVGGQNPLDLTRDSTADDDQPVFSPDGEQIAFRSSRGGGGIFVMGRTGEAVRRVTSVGFHPSWSPDGAHLAFTTESVELYPQNSVGNSELWTVAVNTGETRHLNAGDAALASWSPHNHRIAFTKRLGNPVQGDIWTIPATGGTPTPVTSDPATDWNPAWSPDGKYLYFASDRGGSMNLRRVPIDEVSGKTLGEPEPITTPAQYLAHPSLSADGKRIVYTSALITANIQRLTLDASGGAKGEPAWVTTGSRLWSGPDPSPDGEWVAFYSLTQPGGQLYVAHPDGTGLRRVTSDATDRVPCWSPDSQWIACFSNRSRRLELWKIRPDGSGLQQLTECSAGYHAWSPDGSRIATTFLIEDVAAKPGVLIFDPNRPWKEQTAEVLPPLDPSTDRFLVNSWSPDGRRLVGQVDGERRGIVTYSLASRAYERLTDFGEWPVWLPDSRRVLFVADGKGFFIADTTSRQVRKIFSVARDVIGPPRLTRDGRTAYFSRCVTESDIWLCTLR